MECFLALSTNGFFPAYLNAADATMLALLLGLHAFKLF